MDSGANHNFLSEKVAATAQLPIDRTYKLNARLAYGETRASLVLARVVRVTFTPGVVQTLDFWVVPLAMDAILGTPWLQSIKPAID